MKSAPLLLPLMLVLTIGAPAPAFAQEEGMDRKPLVSQEARFVSHLARAPLAAPGEDRWFAEDKFKHFWLSFGAASLTYGFVDAAGLDWPEAGIAAGVVAGGAGVWKEFRDRARGERFSRKDLVWDALGVGVALLVAARTS